jgi:hypothetical protein
MFEPSPSYRMDRPARLRKKVKEASRLRDVPPERTIETGARMARSARSVAEAADRART